MQMFLAVELASRSISSAGPAHLFVDYKDERCDWKGNRKNENRGKKEKRNEEKRKQNSRGKFFP